MTLFQVKFILNGITSEWQVQSRHFIVEYVRSDKCSNSHLF
jgi:hypothetical protein